jgi:tetratricopeptide (TPR) repeat protein
LVIVNGVDSIYDMKVNYALALIICLAGCSNSKKIAVRSNEAESYYRKAMGILINTSHNALSQSLANEALGYISQAIALNPKQSEYFRVKGTSYFYLKEYDQAITNHDKAIKLDSTNVLAWMGRGIVLENTGKFEQAEQSYLKSLQYDGSNASLYINLGLLYNKWGKDSLSMRAYDQAIKVYPQATSAYINRGEKKLLFGQYDAAIADFNMAISLDPSDKISFNNRGLCHYYLKQYETAIADCKKALSIELGASFNENFDTDKYSYNNIANSYFAMGNTTEACKYWNITIQKGYKYKKEWKAIYNIDDPVELVKKYCQ